jgi:Protein of unknown function (DUF2474)
MARGNEVTRPAPIWQRLGWFGGIWAVSVVALAIVAWVIKWAVKAPI